MKHSLAFLAVLGFCSPAHASDVTDIKIYDHTKRVTQSVPVTERRCQDVNIPIYQQSQGASGGDLLAGILLGGLLGKAATKKDNGAAAGAVIGGIIANENGKKTRVTGYKTEVHCNDITVYQNSDIETYSHSTIRFFLNGKRYNVPFQK